MAYLFNNGNILAKDQSPSANQSIYRFANPQLNAIEWTTIGFIPIGTSNGLNISVVSILCPGSAYNIYLGNSVYLGVDTDNTTLIPVISTSTNMVILTISGNESNITLSKPFTATMTSRPENSFFAITSSNNWLSVGYDSPIPKLLSNCNQCLQCSSGFNCSDRGLCINANISNPCSLTQGLCDGNCFGNCQENARCVRSGNIFTCVSRRGIPPIWAWILILIIIAFISCLIWYLLYKKKIIEINK